MNKVQQSMSTNNLAVPSKSSTVTPLQDNNPDRQYHPDLARLLARVSDTDDITTVTRVHPVYHPT